MSQLTVRLVGNNFRPAGRAVLPTLPINTPLILEPEPTNPHDPNAIKVAVDMIECKDSIFHAEDRIIHLGYIPRIQTASVMAVIQGPDWDARLTFDMTGQPLVCIKSNPSD